MWWVKRQIRSISLIDLYMHPFSFHPTQYLGEIKRPVHHFRPRIAQNKAELYFIVLFRQRKNLDSTLHYHVDPPPSLNQLVNPNFQNNQEEKKYTLNSRKPQSLSRHLKLHHLISTDPIQSGLSQPTAPHPTQLTQLTQLDPPNSPNLTTLNPHHPHNHTTHALSPPAINPQPPHLPPHTNPRQRRLNSLLQLLKLRQRLHDPLLVRLE